MGGRYWVYGGLACLGLVSRELEVLRVARLQLKTWLLIFPPKRKKSTILYFIFYHNKCISHSSCSACVVSYMTIKHWQPSQFIHNHSKTRRSILTIGIVISQLCYTCNLVASLLRMLARVNAMAHMPRGEDTLPFNSSCVHDIRPVAHPCADSNSNGLVLIIVIRISDGGGLQRRASVALD
jgi:hypothetical protein